MTDLSTLERVLEASVRRNGEKPLTNAHLLNILKMARRVDARREEAMDAHLAQVLSEDRMWGASS